MRVTLARRHRRVPPHDGCPVRFSSRTNPRNGKPEVDRLALVENEESVRKSGPIRLGAQWIDYAVAVRILTIARDLHIGVRRSVGRKSSGGDFLSAYSNATFTVGGDR
jgi:hypothetical protein